MLKLVRKLEYLKKISKRIIIREKGAIVPISKPVTLRCDAIHDVGNELLTTVREILIKGVIMKKEDKELLFKDLCSRLPYGVKINAIYSNEHASFYRQRACKNGINELTLNIMWLCYVQNEIDIKPYLFPFSSMTEEQKKEYNSYFASVPYYGDNIHIPYYSVELLIDFYNKHHLDWRGLIPKALAIDATGLNIY